MVEQTFGAFSFRRVDGVAETLERKAFTPKTCQHTNCLSRKGDRQPSLYSSVGAPRGTMTGASIPFGHHRIRGGAGW